jgi:hypothetical protein
VDGADVCTQVVDPVLVVDLSGRVASRVGEGGAVLGDDQRETCATVRLDEELLEATRLDLPADVGERRARREAERRDARELLDARVTAGIGASAG